MAKQRRGNSSREKSVPNRIKVRCHGKRWGLLRGRQWAEGWVACEPVFGFDLPDGLDPQDSANTDFEVECHRCGWKVTLGDLEVDREVWDVRSTQLRSRIRAERKVQSGALIEDDEPFR
jgi:hypothetical protein